MIKRPTVSNLKHLVNVILIGGFDMTYGRIESLLEHLEEVENNDYELIDRKDLEALYAAVAIENMPYTLQQKEEITHKAIEAYERY